MEFFEFILVFSLVFVLPLTILKTVLDYKKARLGSGAGEGATSGVTAGELKQFLRDAVEDANAPLLARIDDLEMAVLRDQADEPQVGEALGDAFDEAEPEEQARTLGRRVAE